MTEAQLQLQLLALNGRPETDAVDLEVPAVALGNSPDHVGHERSRHAPAGAGELGLVARLNVDPAIFELGDDLLGEHRLELALWALDRNILPRHVDGDAGRDRNRFLTYARHDV